jgi:hypothetical protein
MKVYNLQNIELSNKDQYDIVKFVKWCNDFSSIGKISSLEILLEAKDKKYILFQIYINSKNKNFICKFIDKLADLISPYLDLFPNNENGNLPFYYIKNEDNYFYKRATNEQKEISMIYENKYNEYLEKFNKIFSTPIPKIKENLNILFYHTIEKIQRDITFNMMMNALRQEIIIQFIDKIIKKEYDLENNQNYIIELDEKQIDSFMNTLFNNN